MAKENKRKTNRRTSGRSEKRSLGTALAAYSGAMKHFFTVTVVLALLIGTGVGGEYLSRDDVMAIKKVKLVNDLAWQQPIELQEIINDTAKGNFLTLNAVELRASIESLAWIDQTSVRRQWPDTIEISVVEQQPRFRWAAISDTAETGIISDKGKLIKPTMTAEQAKSINALALIVADKEQLTEAVALWDQLSPILSSARIDMAELRIDDRHAAKLVTTNGMQLMLGRTIEMEKVTRFVAIYWAQLKDYQQNIKQIDLRYTNGFAIAWHERQSGNENFNNALDQKNTTATKSSRA